MKHVENMLDRLPSSRRAVRVAIAALIVVIFGLIGILFWQVHENSQVAAENAAVARSRGQALGTANAKLTQNGIPAVKPTKVKATPGDTNVGPTTPSSTPSAERGRRGETGAQGPGPSAAQIDAAVEQYCSAHGDCQGKPTKAQVAAAVLTYCDKRDDCQGPTGPTGGTGETGEPGKDGAQGPGPTADEVADAVAAYCADSACRGATGPTGPAGPAGKDGSNGKDGANGSNGKDGATITKIECTDANTWRFTESDGTVLTAAGPCRASTTTVTVTETPSPTSTP